MSEETATIKKEIEAIALGFVTMEADDIPMLGEMLNHLSVVDTCCETFDAPGFRQLVQALNQYLERVVLRETADLKPFETGLEHLQAWSRNLCNQKTYDADLTPVLTALGIQPGQMAQSVQDEKAAAPETETQDSGGEAFESPSSEMSDEDRNIIFDFISESLEGLETIEVSLIDLEQNPDDKESINAIFRCFHTIKGVSSFLGFARINRLAHRAENLLEKIRSDEIIIDGEITDIILDSMDLLKQLVEGIRNGMDNGGPLDLGLDIGPLVFRIEAVQDQSEKSCRPLGEILVDQGGVTHEAVEGALKVQQNEPDRKIGEILVEQGKANTRQVVEAIREQKKCGARSRDLQVKVDTDKLDNLVDMTGELVIAQAMLRQHPYVQAGSDQRLVHTLGQLNQITSSLQKMAMSLRMVPIKSTFQKMVRLVRDLSRHSHKKVQLIMEGEETEIDRNVVDELYEPMVHMIRNAVDHGLETPAERLASGKNETGQIHLRAYHRGGNIVVEISDDGRGLNRDRILEKALSKGLIEKDERLPDSDIYNLIFHPGFSTATQVSEISGRGVGMDVVKKGIEKLRGRIDISSIQGKGSTFLIRLPLTLAIIEGMLVKVGRERYVIPTLGILESFRPTADQYFTVEGKGEMLMSRGTLIPMVRLDQLFDLETETKPIGQGLAVTLEHDGKRMCLFLDELLGKEEVVIKSMGESMKEVKGIAGGAILGDGRVGLILDLAGVWELAIN